MYCVEHPDRQVAGACTRCGRFFCDECVVVVSGRNLCRACVSQAFEEQKQQPAVPPAAIPAPVIINNNANAQQMGLPYASVHKSAGLAAFLSFAIPGLGQVYCGRLGRAILFFLGTVALMPVFIGIFIWIWNIIDAYGIAKRYPMP